MQLAATNIYKSKLSYIYTAYCTAQDKTSADSELQENWWRKFWQLITLMIVHYQNLQHLTDKTLADC